MRSGDGSESCHTSCVETLTLVQMTSDATRILGRNGRDYDSFSNDSFDATAPHKGVGHRYYLNYRALCNDFARTRCNKTCGGIPPNFSGSNDLMSYLSVSSIACFLGFPTCSQTATCLVSPARRECLPASSWPVITYAIRSSRITGFSHISRADWWTARTLRPAKIARDVAVNLNKASTSALLTATESTTETVRACPPATRKTQIYKRPPVWWSGGPISGRTTSGL